MISPFPCRSGLKRGTAGELPTFLVETLFQPELLNKHEPETSAHRRDGPTEFRACDGPDTDRIGSEVIILS